MDRKAKSVIYIVTCGVLIIISFISAAYACQVDDFYMTKEGNLAAVTPEALNDILTSAQGNQAKLTGLLQAGTVLKLKEGIKVQVLERSVEWNMLKIKLPDRNATYWVKDGSLRPIDCK